MSEGLDPVIGYTFGRYTVERILDEEWLGRVYMARGRKGTLVCVKVLHPHLAESEEVISRFHQEMLATASVEHPNTVHMLDFGEQRMFRFVVLEYVAGDSLRELMDRGEAFPAKRVAAIAAQVADVLALAHEHGIVHRNLSPLTISLLRNARGDFVKVKDFGMSKLRDDFEGGGAQLTAIGSRLGTAGYMAPEYIDGNVVDPRGDLYALGLVMFELLAGRPPFEGKPGAVLEAHVTRDPPRPSELAKVPQWLEDLILQCLAKRPDERPADAREVVGRLEQGLGHRVELPELIPVGEDGEPIEEIKRRSTLAGSREKGGALKLVGAVLAGVMVAVIVAVLLAVAMLLVMG